VGSIRFGLAGWDYADWQGIVYPARPQRGFDRLAYISRYVDAIEINSSFYRPVVPRNAESWVRRTADRPGFRFTAKAHRSWTHEPDSDPARVVPQTLEGLRPLKEAEALGAVLIQFPQSFHFTVESTDRIERLLEGLGGWRAVVEVRHRSWESEEALRFFDEHRVGWCAVDQPQVGGSTARRLPRVTTPVAYLRLHGRNTHDWFRPDAGRDARYDYLYTKAQLGDLGSTVRGMAELSEELFVIQNNHFRGQALVNTLQFKKLLGDRSPRAPQELVAAYPELGPDVTVERHGLF